MKLYASHINAIKNKATVNCIEEYESIHSRYGVMSESQSNLAVQWAMMAFKVPKFSSKVGLACGIQNIPEV